MTLLHRLSREEEGASTIEMAFALPTMIVMIWCVLQLGIMFQAMSGIQHALGEGARYATIFPTPSTTAIAPLLRTANRSPATPRMNASPLVAP